MRPCFWLGLLPTNPSSPQFPPICLWELVYTLHFSSGAGYAVWPVHRRWARPAPPSPSSGSLSSTAGGALPLPWNLLLSSLPPHPTCLALRPATAQWALCVPAVGWTPAHPGRWVWVLVGTNTKGTEIMENARISHLLLQVQSRSNAELPAASGLASLPLHPAPWAPLFRDGALAVTPALACPPAD